MDMIARRIAMMIFALGWLCIASYAQLALGDLESTVSTDYDAYNKGKLGHRPHLEYQSCSEFTPLLQVNTWNESAIASKGSHIFIRHDGIPESPLAAPLILDAKDLSAVYVNRSFDNVFGTRVQENEGKKYLTFWHGQKGDGVGNGFGVAYDHTYKLVYNISAHGIPAHADLHEFSFTGHGTVLVTGVDKVRADTSSWTGWRGASTYPVLDALFQEIDLETNKLIFSWRALNHINPMDSLERPGNNWDIYHMNSVQKTKAGNYLISMRHTGSIYLINGKTGKIIWTLGGKRNDFTELPPPEGADTRASLLSMSWQHHARYLPNTDETEMTFFDNHGKTTSHGKCKNDCSRGVHIAIDDKASPPTVQLLREYIHPSRLRAQSQGNVQPLSAHNGEIGNVFIGWGRCPSFTEHDASGETVMDVQFSPWHSAWIPDALDNYRAYKMDWVGTPWWDPSIMLKENPETGIDIYVSWNGATEVTEWVVRGQSANTNSSETLKRRGNIITRVPRTGFETRLSIDNEDSMRYIWAEAMDKHGSALGSTDIWLVGGGSMSVIKESQKPPSVNLAPNKVYDEPVPLKTWIMLGVGIFLIVSTLLTVGIIWWRYRMRVYDRLEGRDLDSDVGEDMDSVLGLEDFIVDSTDDGLDDMDDKENLISKEKESES